MKATFKIAKDSISHKVLDDLKIPYSQKSNVISVTLKNSDYDRFEKLLAERMKWNQPKPEVK